MKLLLIYALSPVQTMKAPFLGAPSVFFALPDLRSGGGFSLLFDLGFFGT